MSDPAPAPAPETKNTTRPAREPTPRIDFESMSIEELEAFVEKPIEKVPQPNKKAMEDAVAAIDAQIVKMKARFDDIKAEKEMIYAGYKLQKEANMESQASRKALFDSRKELTAQREATMTEFRALKDELEVIRGSVKQGTHMKPAEIAQKIDKAEIRIETESLSMKEEKDLRRQITLWAKDLRDAKSVDGLVERRIVLEESMKTVRATLDDLKKKLDDVYSKLGAVSVKKEKTEEGEEKKKEEEEKKDDPIKKLNDEWENNKAAIDDKYTERKEVQNEFYTKDRAYKQYSFENKRMMVARRVLEDKEAEVKEIEQQKLEAEAELKKHPFEKQMLLCDTVLSYLQSVLPVDAKSNKPVAAAVNVPEGMVLLKKVEEDYFFIASSKKDKREKKNKKDAKKATITHNLQSLESFATIRVPAPKKVDDVAACIEVVKARKEFFNTLPRGSDVDAEIAKLN